MSNVRLYLLFFVMTLGVGVRLILLYSTLAVDNAALYIYQMETRCCKVSVSKLRNRTNKQLNMSSYHSTAVGKTGKMFFFSSFCFHATARGANSVCVRCKCQHADPNTLPHAAIDLRSRHVTDARLTRFVPGERPMSVDDGLDNIMWIRVVSGRR